MCSDFSSSLGGMGGIPTSINEEALAWGNNDDDDVVGRTDTPLEGNTEVEVAVEDGR